MLLQLEGCTNILVHPANYSSISLHQQHFPDAKNITSSVLAIAVQCTNPNFRNACVHFTVVDSRPIADPLHCNVLNFTAGNACIRAREHALYGGGQQAH